MYGAISADFKLINNDVSATPSGDIDLVRGDASLVQMAIDNLKTIFGELVLDTQRGNMVYYRRLKLVDSSLPQIEADCKDAILRGDPRIKDVPMIKATLDTSSRFTCWLDFQLMKQDGTIIATSTMIDLGR